MCGGRCVGEEGDDMWEEGVWEEEEDDTWEEGVWGEGVWGEVCVEEDDVGGVCGGG